MRWAIYLIFSFTLFLNLNNSLEAKSNLDIDKSLSIYNINSNWINQDGTKISFHDLSGKPIVLAMIYTSCTSACPVIISDIKKIEQAIQSKNKDLIRFVLISFDSTTDKAKQLMEFGKKHKLDLKHWTLLTGNKDGVRELATVLGIQYKQETDGSYLHSSVITLIDPLGIIRHQQNGLNQDPKPMVDVLNKIIEQQ